MRISQVATQLHFQWPKRQFLRSNTYKVMSLIFIYSRLAISPHESFLDHRLWWQENQCLKLASLLFWECLQLGCLATLNKPVVDKSDNENCMVTFLPSWHQSSLPRLTKWSQWWLQQASLQAKGPCVAILKKFLDRIHLHNSLHILFLKCLTGNEGKLN